MKRTVIEEEAKIHAQNPIKVSKFNQSLGKFANHKAVKEHYLQGSTVKSNRIVGGIQSNEKTIERKLGDSQS